MCNCASLLFFLVLLPLHNLLRFSPLSIFVLFSTVSYFPNVNQMLSSFIFLSIAPTPTLLFTLGCASFLLFIPLPNLSLHLFMYRYSKIEMVMVFIYISWNDFRVTRFTYSNNMPSQR